MRQFGSLALVALVFNLGCDRKSNDSGDPQKPPLPLTISNGLPTVDLKLPRKSLAKLLDKRKRALEVGVLIKEKGDEVPGVLTVGNKSVPVEVRLKGDMADHIKYENWSVRIKVASDDAVLGMRKFSIQDIGTRKLGEALMHRHMRSKGILTPRYRYVNYVRNGENQGIMALEEHFSKELLEAQQRRETPIFKYNEDYIWDQLFVDTQKDIKLMPKHHHVPFGRAYFMPMTIFKRKSTMKKPALRRVYHEALSLLRGFKNDQIPADQVFNMPQIAQYLAVVHLWGAQHGLAPHNTRLYYDPFLQRFEPISFDNNPHNPPRARELSFGAFEALTSKVFIDRYSDAVKELAAEVESGEVARLIAGFEDELWADTPKDKREDYGKEFGPTIRKMVANLPEHQPDDEDFDHNQGVIEVKNPELVHFLLALYYEKDGRGYVEFKNAIDRDVTVTRITVKRKKKGKKVISREEIIVPPSRAWDDRVVRSVPLIDPAKKDRITVRASYRPGDVRKIRALIYSPVATETIFAAPSASDLASGFPFLRQEGRKFVVPAGTHPVARNLIVPEGYSLTIEPGARLEFAPDAGMVINGDFTAVGTEAKPIQLAGTTWAGVLARGEGTTSHLEHVTITGIHDTAARGWGFTGAMSFYLQHVVIKNCLFEGLQKEDALNIVRSTFEVEKSSFLKSKSDAIDSDFSNGHFADLTFEDIGGDAVDVSGSRVTLVRSHFTNVGDKVVSVGEESQLEAEALMARGAAYGFVVKDGSKGQVSRSEFKEITESVLAAYIKKKEYGPGTLTASEITHASAAAFQQSRDGCEVVLR